MNSYSLSHSYTSTRLLHPTRYRDVVCGVFGSKSIHLTVTYPAAPLEWMDSSEQKRRGF